MFPEVPGYNPDNPNKDESDKGNDTRPDQTDSKEVGAGVKMGDVMRGHRVAPSEIATLNDFNEDRPISPPTSIGQRIVRTPLPSSASKREGPTLRARPSRGVSIGAGPMLRSRERTGQDRGAVKDPGIETMKTSVQAILDKHSLPLVPVISRADSTGRTKRYALDLKQPKGHRGPKLPGQGARFVGTGREILKEFEQHLHDLS